MKSSAQVEVVGGGVVGEIVGRRRPASLLTEPVFDPAGLRMRT